MKSREYRVSYMLSGDVDVDKMGERLGCNRNDLAAVLREVWADAYARGWSDGQADRDPDILDNPYSGYEKVE